MFIGHFAGMGGVRDVSSGEELVDDDEDVQGKPILITTHSDIIDDHVAEMLCE